ncbi:MAG: type II toxin-antitoxin system RelE/ParE family toxin [Thioalkalivibrio sp.]|nr:type II toxin-antitoxin system RelE/ParE family toxin [Thioalkalivibrio sp.]
MDCRVVWSPAALEDAEAIAEFIARDSPRYASAVVRRLRDNARSLGRFPFWTPKTAPSPSPALPLPETCST